MCEVDFEGVKDELREWVCVLSRHVKQLEEELNHEMFHHKG